MALQAVAVQLEGVARRHDAKECAKKRESLKTKLADGRQGLQTACGLLRPLRAVPLSTLRTPGGEYTSDPLEVDHAAAEAWDHIFNPGEDDPLDSLKTCLEHVGQTAAVADEFPLPPWGVQQFLDILRAAMGGGPRRVGTPALAAPHSERR